MKKSERIILNLFVVGLISLPLISFAQGGLYSSSGVSIQSLAVSLANAVWVVFTIIAVIAFIMAAIMFLTAFGEAEKLAKARSAFIWGVVGVIVALLAFGIITLIRTAIGA